MGLGIRLDYILSVLHPRSGYKRPMQSVYTQRLVAMVKRSLQIFIVFICVTILLLTFYLIKRRLSEFLNRRALNHPNRDEGELCGDKSLLVHCFYLSLNISLSFESISSPRKPRARMVPSGAKRMVSGMMSIP